MILADAAIPLHTAVKYVAAAYCVFLAILLIYLAIMARRTSRVERELVELNARLAAPDSFTAQAVGQNPAGHGRPEVDPLGQDAGLEAPRR